jgi:hypothetical protein
MVQHCLGYEPWGGWVFVRGALGELADRRPGMMTLIGLAISVAFVFGLAVTFGLPGTDLWWELAKLLPDTAVRIVGRQHSCRWHRARWRERRERVDDHRRVTAGAQGGERSCAKPANPSHAEGAGRSRPLTRSR